MQACCPNSAYLPPGASERHGLGAYINSDSFRSLGAEVETEVDLGHGLRMRGNYTSLDAGRDAVNLQQAARFHLLINPAFPQHPRRKTFSPLDQGAPRF